MLLIGNWMMVLCAVFYLAWWRITFRPPAPEGTPLGRICIILAFVSGIAGIVLAIAGMNGTSKESARTGLSGIMIVIGGVILYALLLAISSKVLHRQVTSELMIIIMWTVLELCAINHWFESYSLSQSAAVIFAVIVILTAIASLICYLQYYRVSYEQGYLIGSIPLVLTGIVMTLFNLVVMISRGSVK